MSAVSEALMRRIGKIKELAERGVDGEKAAAQSMLEKILVKHGLTLADIEGKPKREWVELTFSGEYEKLLLTQIVRKAAGVSGDLVYRWKKGTRTRIKFELSPVEHVEVEFMFELMKKALADEFSKVLSAFIHTNRLFGPSVEDDEDDKDEPEKTPEERARLRQIAAMMSVMSPVKVHKAIEQ
jgi:hypothetical protein